MNKIKYISLILGLMVLFSGNSFSQSYINNEDEVKVKKWFKPDYLKVQYAGNIGFMSIGLGYNWWREIAQSDLLYGYVPENIGDATIHTFTIKNTFCLYRFNILNKYNLSTTLGFSLSMEPGQNSFMSFPEKYPDGYHTRNCFYACLNAGINLNLPFKDERCFSAMDLYFEYNTLADYAFYYIVAQKDRSNQIFSMALGVNLFF